MLKQATKFAPAPEAFRAAREAGFDFAELWSNDRLYDDWQAVAELARSFPLRYALHAPNKGDLHADRRRGLVELARALDVSAVVIHPPMFARFGEALWELDPRLPLSVENGRLDPRQFGEWANRFRWLTLDVEHLWAFTLEDAPLAEVLDAVDRFLDEHAVKLRHVHLPGYVPGWATHRPMYCNRDFVLGVFDLLAEREYDGLIVSEVGTAFQNVNELTMDRLLYATWEQSREGRSRRKRRAVATAAR